MKKKLLYLLIILIATVTCLNSCSDSKSDSSLDFKVEIEYEDCKMVDTTVLLEDSTSFKWFNVKQGYDVKISMSCIEDTRVTDSYYKECFVESKNKHNIPSIVCEIKNDILRERELDKSISKEIDEIKESINCNSS